MKMLGFLNQSTPVTSGVIQGFIAFINIGVDSNSGAIEIPLRCLHFHGNRVLAVNLDCNICSFLFIVYYLLISVISKTKSINSPVRYLSRFCN